MKKFLELVAKDLYAKYGNDIADVAVVFPNRRAELFFNIYLHNEAQKTIWTPKYFTISNLLQNLSPLTIADDLLLIAELYNVYKDETKSAENFSDFYFWGELLLHDFDDVDKNMAKAELLFRNLKELKELKNTFDFLDDSQRAAIEQFFANFSFEKQSNIKQKFTAIWDVLGNIYTQFKSTLHTKKIAYEGMLYRDVVESLQENIDEKFPLKKYVFVGFNVLNVCEEQLFTKLKNADKAIFYWDYDTHYTSKKNHEAGKFITENLKNFPSELPADLFDSGFVSDKKIRIISSTTENAQARYTSHWISDLEKLNQKANSSSAIVLCNENLLLPTIHSLPNSVEDINITMGFPLSQTPIFNTIESLLNLQIKGAADTENKYFYKDYVLQVLQNQYLQNISENTNKVVRKISENVNTIISAKDICTDENISLLFKPNKSALDIAEYLLSVTQKITTARNKKNQLYDEAIFRVYTTITRLAELIRENNLLIDKTTFVVLLRQMLFATKIPFHGEPVKGLQIMGVLETRNLDFDNILLFSANENLLPKSTSEASFIPHNLRVAFGLTTVEHRNSVYAYYFYRLLQRAKNVSITYNSATEGVMRGEMSRFVLQLILETQYNIDRYDIHSQVILPQSTKIEVVKTNEILHVLAKRFSSEDKVLSPSALNAYIDCPLQFYFKYVAELKLPKNDNANDSLLLGNLVHDSLQAIYRKFDSSRNVNADDIENISKNKTEILDIIDKVFAEKTKISKENYNGKQIILRDVACAYITKMLKLDAQYAPFAIIGIEKKIATKMQFVTNIGNIDLNIGGYADRCDLKNGALRILDYKTGGEAKIVSSIENLFLSAKNRNKYAFQVLLYAWIEQSQNSDYKIVPAIAYINKAMNNLGSMQLKFNKTQIDDVTQISDEFGEHLNTCISNLFDTNIPFYQTDTEDICKYCDFKQICKR